jgi:hypothetical protein
MVYVEVIFQGDVDWTTIPNTRVVESFPRVKHIPHGLPLEHHGMEIKVHGLEIKIHGQAISPHKIELLQQIGQPTPNTSGRARRAIKPPLQRGWLRLASQQVDLVSPPRAKKEMLSTL